MATPQEFASLDADSGYPSALTIMKDDFGSGFRPRPSVELEILEIEGTIKEKENWWNKVNDPKIVSKWRQEIMDQLYRDAEDLRQLNQEESEGQKNSEYRGKMVDYAIKECQWQAEQCKEGAARFSAVDGVFVRDDLDERLCAKLLRDIAELRSKPAIGASKEDRHPGTPQMVDLVHPSMYAYERGKTMVLPGVGAEATKMPEWSSFLGREGIIEEPLDMTKLSGRRYHGEYSPSGLQWLPSEFLVSGDGKSCEINSYVNSLHPVEYADLYKSVADLFCHAVPLLKEVLAEAGEHKGVVKHDYKTMRERGLRVPVDYEWWTGGPREQQSDEDTEAYEEYLENLSTESKTFLYPEIPEFKGPPEFTCERADVNLLGVPLQVIVKIASLELNPKESYEGGVWHVEGTLGERIVATACCYLECDNVTGGQLEFRTSVAEPSYEQNDRKGVENMYDLTDNEPLMQQAGSCVTRQGRVLAWPNTKQHKVSPVRLVDSEKPGKRTICCFFLVDPKLRIRSTATVPPQQLAWVSEGTSSPSLLTYEGACERRERLMNERRKPDENSRDYITRGFSLCEH